MKSIKFLAALAIPAMFAACTNEEIVSEKPQQLNEVVGAELIGTDVSIKAFDGVDSRLNSEGWQTTDKLGVAWIVNGAYDSDQFINNGPDNNKWVANHMFVAEDGKLVTKGNIYKGWHFAYFPFKYTETISEQTFDINPAQTSKVWNGGRINDALHISTLKFLDRKSLDENYQILPEVGLMPQRVVNAIRVTTNYSGEFAEGKTLAGLGVNSVTLTVDEGYNVFSNTVIMNVKNLPQDTDSQNPVTEEEFHNKMYKGGANAVLRKYAPSNTITTDVSKAGFVTGEVGNLYTLTISESTDKLTNDGVKIQVNVDGGYFLVKYTDKPEAELTNEEKLNNDAIIALKEAYATGGDMTKVGKNLILNVYLYNDIFHTDFDHISNLEDWKEAVDLVTKLGRNVEFGITDVIEFTERSIPMPEGYTITVNASADAQGAVGLKVPAKKTLTNWPAGLTSNVDVINEGTITNATGINGSKIENKGTLKGITGEIASLVVNNEGTITLTKTGALTNVKNEGGRINVVYGSKVITTGGANNGIIAYTIGTKEYAYKLNNLMNLTSGQTSSANVNTLVINSGKTLNLGLTDSGRADSDDPYNPTGGTDDVKLESLANINIELNGGEIVGVETNNAVNNVIMDGGIVNGVNINGTLTAVSGTVTSETIGGAVVAENTVITAETIGNNVTLKGENTINGAAITGDVTVETGTTTLNDVQIDGTLTIKNGASVVLNSQKSTSITNLDNYGNLTSNNDIYTVNVNLNGSSTTYLKGDESTTYDKVIWYTGSANHKDVLLGGNVWPADGLAPTMFPITPETGKTYMLTGDFQNENINIVMPVGVKDVVFDGTNAKNIKELIITQNGQLIDNVSHFEGVREGKLTIKNFNIASQINVFASKTEVEICGNTAEALLVYAGNCALNIHDNEFDANFESHPIYRDATTTWGSNNYGVQLRIFDYDLWFDNNIVTDATGHVVAINGYEDNFANAINNEIHSFTGNNITVNSTTNTKRAAFKIWADGVYAPQNPVEGHKEVNEASQEFINDVLANGENTFNIVDGYNHTIFCIYDVNTNN